MSENYAERGSLGGGADSPSPGSGPVPKTESSDRESLGHHPVIPPRIGKSPSRLDSGLLERYRTSAVTDVSDAVGRLYTMDGEIRPLYEPMRRVVGVALTVKAPPGDNWAIHGALSMAGQDDVLIVDWRGYSEGCGAGAKVLMPAIRRGLAGVVVDGGWRDVGDLQALDFPMCGRAISAFSPAKRELGEINVPVCCGRVIVEPGDVVVADGEGSVIVPRRHAAEVARYLPDPEQENSADGPPHDAERAGRRRRRSALCTLVDEWRRSLRRRTARCSDERCLETEDKRYDRGGTAVFRRHRRASDQRNGVRS